MTLIKKPNEVKINKTIKALILGTTGSGKTTLAISSEKPLLVDCEGGIERVRVNLRTDFVECKKFDMFLELLKSDDVNNFKTIVIDPLGEFVEQIKAYVIRKDKKIESDPRKLYPLIVKEFKTVWNLLQEKELSIIFVGHTEEIMKTDVESYKIQVEGNGVKNFLPTKLDIVGMLRKIERDGKVKRLLSFEQNDSITFAKRENDMKPIYEINETLGNSNTFFKDVIFKDFCDSKDKQIELSGQFDSLISLINERIDGIETINDAKDYFSNSYQKLEKIWSSDLYEKDTFKKKVISFIEEQINKLQNIEEVNDYYCNDYKHFDGLLEGDKTKTEALKKRVEALGLEFDAKAKVFKVKEVKKND